MKTASFVGVNLPQTPVHLVQILNSIFQWGDFNPFYEDIQLDDERSKPNEKRLGLTRIYAFFAKIYQSQIMRFWVKF